jgi:hypothetical protein
MPLDGVADYVVQRVQAELKHSSL